jgi:hypothetical protein
MKPLFLTLLVLLLRAPAVRAAPDAEELEYVRTVSLYAGYGSEIFYLGALFQVNQQYSVGPFLGGFLVRSDGRVYGIAGLGLRNTFYLSPYGKGKFLRVNNLTVDLLYLPEFESSRSQSYWSFHGVGIETTVGHDCILGWGIGVSWGVGFSLSFHRETQPYIGPALKLGLHIDV